MGRRRRGARRHVLFHFARLRKNADDHQNHAPRQSRPKSQAGRRPAGFGTAQERRSGSVAANVRRPANENYSSASHGIRMNKPLRILLIEDSEADAALILCELQRSGYDATLLRVETAPEMAAALDRQAWPIIISDYSMPQFDAPRAL